MFNALIQVFIPQAKQSTQSVPQAPTLIAPSDFVLVGGGCPRGGWLEAVASVDCPRGGWLEADA